MKLRKYLGPNRLFVWHSLNGIGCILLIITGFSMYFTELGEVLMPFEWHHFIHEWTGIIICVAYILIFIFFHLEANHHRVHFWWRILLQPSKTDRTTNRQVRRQFKPVIAVRYSLVMFLIFPILMSTGSILIFPELLNKRIIGFDLYRIILVLHIIAALLILLFTIIHVYIALINKKRAVGLHQFFKFWYKT